MAGGKVREWIRKRTMPRKAAAAERRSGGASGASTPILKEEAGSGSGRGSSAIGAASSPVAGKAARSGAGGMTAPARSKARASAFSSALRRWPRVNVLAELYEKVVYHLLWLVESVVVVARLCFFLMRFGFKQL